MNKEFDEKGWDNHWALFFGLLIIPIIVIMGFIECTKSISNQGTQNPDKSYCYVVTTINQTKNNSSENSQTYNRQSQGVIVTHRLIFDNSINNKRHKE